MQFFQLDIRLRFRTHRIDDGENNEGAEHVQDQRRNDKFGVEHGHISADNRQGNGRHGGRSHGEQTARGEIPQHAFVGNEVFRLAEDQRAHRVKRFQLAHTDKPNKNRQDPPVLENTNQCGNKNNRAKHAKENERQPFFTHSAKDKIGAFASKFQQGFKEAGNVFNQE